MPRCPPRKDVPFAVDVRGFETTNRNERNFPFHQTKKAYSRMPQTVDKTLLVSTPEAFFLFWVQKVCT